MNHVLQNLLPNPLGDYADYLRARIFGPRAPLLPFGLPPASWVAGSGTVTSLSSPDGSITIANPTTTPTLVMNPNFENGYALVNGYLSCTVASNALTIAIKNSAGNDPSAANPVMVVFRNATAATGDFTVITLTAATSLVISSGSTMGFANATPARLWIVGFNDGGTFRIGAVNCLSGTNIFPLRDDMLLSATSEGGAGAADSAQVVYSNATVTTKALRILGYLDWSAGLTTAGTWAIVPTKVQLFGPGVALPGQTIQTVISATGAVSTGSTTVPFDDTIPQNTEGNQYLTQSITPSATMNLLAITSQLMLTNTAQVIMVASLFQDSTANALATSVGHLVATGGFLTIVAPQTTIVAGTVSSTTINARAGGHQAGTTTFNGQTSARKFGGVANSFLQISEIMG